jgi:hypothetical protein
MEEKAVGVAQDPTKLDVKPKISNRHVVAENKRKSERKRKEGKRKDKRVRFPEMELEELFFPPLESRPLSSFFLRLLLFVLSRFRHLLE